MKFYFGEVDGLLLVIWGCIVIVVAGATVMPRPAARKVRPLWYHQEGMPDNMTTA
jgi:hypothetical protein